MYLICGSFVHFSQFLCWKIAPKFLTSAILNCAILQMTSRVDPLVTWNQMSLLNTLWNKRMFTWFLIEKCHIFIMVKRCVIQFCSNSNKTGHTMHKLPKDANLRRQWIKFLQVKRADFVEPTKHSAICNIHFCPDCYEKGFMVEMGLRKQSLLLSGAVPTIQSLAATNSAEKVLRILFTAQDGSAIKTCLQEDPSTNEQVADRQCIEISYTKSTEK